MSSWKETHEALLRALGDLNEARDRLDSLGELEAAARDLLAGTPGALERLQRAVGDLDDPRAPGGHGWAWARYRLALDLLHEAREESP